MQPLVCFSLLSLSRWLSLACTPMFPRLQQELIQLAYPPEGKGEVRQSASFDDDDEDEEKDGKEVETVNSSSGFQPHSSSPLSAPSGSDGRSHDTTAKGANGVASDDNNITKARPTSRTSLPALTMRSAQ
jgi:hypothetical protein